MCNTTVPAGEQSQDRSLIRSSHVRKERRQWADGLFTCEVDGVLVSLSIASCLNAAESMDVLRCGAPSFAPALPSPLCSMLFTIPRPMFSSKNLFFPLDLWKGRTGLENALASRFPGHAAPVQTVPRYAEQKGSLRLV